MLYRTFLFSFFLSLPLFGLQSNQNFCKTPNLQDEVIEKLKENLSKDYKALMNALKNNKIKIVKRLFAQNKFLKDYAINHEEGTPLEFTRSFAMAKFLLEKMGFNANLCDQWGNMPSKTILLAPDRFFVTPDEKQKIADYYQAHEDRFVKIYYQLTRNKKIYQTACALTITTFLIALDIYLLKSVN